VLVAEKDVFVGWAAAPPTAMLPPGPLPPGVDPAAAAMLPPVPGAPMSKEQKQQQLDYAVVRCVRALRARVCLCA
jgi:hypothetical protein